MRFASLAAALTVLAACSVPTATRLDVDAGDPDGAADAPMRDSAPPDAMLSPAALTAMPAADAAFGDVVLGQTSGAQGYTISNDGDQASGTIAIAFDDATLGFALATDTCTGTALAGHHTCTFGVTFAPAAAGAADTTARVTASPGGEVDRDVGGNGLQPGAIDLVEHGHDFGDQGVDDGPVTHSFDVTNGGQAVIGMPAITIGGATDAYFLDSTTCTTTLAPGAHCAVVVRFDPATVGAKAGSLTVTSSPGGSDAATLSGNGVAHVTVTLAGTGGGEVDSNQPGITCGTSCDADFSSTPVTLTETNPAGSTFTGWSGDCAGMGSCTLDLTGSKKVTATFTAITPALTVASTGSGTGVIASTPAGITCGAACSAQFTYGTMVTLTATPAVGSTFGGWSGACSGTGMCMVTMSQAASVTAEFDAVTPTLSLAVGGAGTGTVVSNPSGLACAPTCSASFAYGANVVLTAQPATGSSFTGWGGACSGTKTTCTVAMTQMQSVTATFDPITPTLTVALAGTGTGAVSSSPAGISCGATCSAQFGYAVVVTLTAAAQAGSQFTGWSGACTGTGTCSVSMDQARNVIATFAPFTPTLTVTLAGTSTGSVASTPAGISCGATCAHAYAYLTMVTLTATIGTGATFTGWSGDCAGTTTTCTVTLDQARNVTATFDATTPALGVSLTGGGSGTVTSSPAGIDCGTGCNASYTYGTIVTLTATAQTGSTFGGWGGACSGTTPTCAVTIDRARAVTAEFDAVTPSLTVALAGTGTGSVVSSPAGISCGGTCTSTFAYAAMVTLTPTAAAGSTFTGWSGDCSGASTCTVSMTTAHNVTATFAINTYDLTTSTAGNGAGAIGLSPAGTSCGPSCAAFTYGTVVVLTATPQPGSTFTGWSGDCSVTGPSCTITIDGAHAATATFTLQTFPLTLSVSGGGTVTPSPAGASCGTSCYTYNYGQTVTLAATSTTGSTFAGWSGADAGACAGTTSPTCTVTVTQAKTISAAFTLNTYDLTIGYAGSGTGVATVAPGGASCGNGCSAFPYGQMVTLTATASAGSTFAGWSGSGASTCAGTTTPTCALTIDQARSVTATFTLDTENLTILATDGTVTLSAAGTSCGYQCTTFPYGTTVTLTAAAQTGYTFAGWSGADSGTCNGTNTTTCTVTMDQARTITATFDATPEALQWSVTGAGSIALSSAGTTCGATCALFGYGTMVTLTETPAAGWSFNGWSGACAGTNTTCLVTMTQAENVAATFTQQTFQLNTSTNGTGGGAISASASGTPCGATCASYPYGTMLTLTATPSAGSTFTGWGGACSGSGNCAVTMTQAQSVSATFTLVNEPLTWTINGSGTLALSSAGTSCGATCASFPYDTMVTITPTAGTGSSFTGWGGACSGNGNCTVTMTQAQNVTATFSVLNETLTWSTTGNGSVSFSSGGTSCGTGCLTFPYGTNVTATATPGTGSSLSAWGGACGGAGNCQIAMTAARSLTAAFTLDSYTVTFAATGSGTIVSSPSGIDCGNGNTQCSGTWTYGTSVSLTETPAVGWTFSSWTGGLCSGGSSTCPLTITGSGAVGATFAAITPTMSVTVNGNGGGVVTDNLGKINCASGTCTGTYGYNQVVTLTPGAYGGSTFTGWGGACASAGTGACTLTLTQAQAATATFALNNYGVQVSTTGAGSGTITSNIGITCPGTCSAAPLYGTPVTLTATPAAGSVFYGWSGVCAGQGATCTFTLSQVTNVVAEFDPSTATLTVVKPSGTMTSTPAGINCGALQGSCSASFQVGASVTLKFVPKIVTGCTLDTVTWSGSPLVATCDTTTCTFAMPSAGFTATVTAGFDCSQ